jgi:hypothetical protein
MGKAQAQLHANRRQGGIVPVQPRDIVFTREDGSQVLVTVWTDDHVRIAERHDTHDTWGPPLVSSFDSQPPAAADIGEDRAHAGERLESMSPDEFALLEEVAEEVDRALGGRRADDARLIARYQDTIERLTARLQTLEAGPDGG